MWKRCGRSDQERSSIGCLRGRTAGLAILLVLAGLGQATAQDDYEARIDEAAFGLTDFEREIFRRGQKRRELPCKIRVTDPKLWFDFRLHSTFEAVFSRGELQEIGDWVRLAAMVTPLDRPREAAAVVWTLSRQRLEQDPKARSTGVNGMLLLGEGDYRLDWLIRDQRGRVCYEPKKIKAKLSRGDRKVELRLGPGEFEFFQGASSLTSKAPYSDGPLHLKLLLNVPPFSQPDRRLYASDIYMFVSILDRIAADPQVGRLDIVGFNLRDRKVLFRQEDARAPDYDALFRSVSGINNHEIQLESLRKGSSARFLTELINCELIDPADAVDAAVFIGPRTPLRRNVPDEVLDGLDPTQLPVYYLKYRYTPWGGNWKDSISRVVSAGGGREFGLLSPKDLWVSVEKMVREIGERAGENPRAGSSR